MKIPGSVVIITGASAGIGLATAELLAAQGAHVIITARRAERLDELTARLAVYPGKRLAIAGDIGDEPFAQQLVNQTIAEFGRVDVLVNNAGLGHKSPLADMATSEIHTIWNTNVMGLLYATRAVIPHMKQQKQGQIVNVSSIVGQRPLPLNAVYCASKTAVNFLSRTLRMELRPYGLTVTLVYPGLTVTEFAQARFGAKGANPYLRGVPAGRVGQAIVKGIQNGRSEVYITLTDWLFCHFNRLFPNTIDWAIGRFMKVK